MLVAKLIAVFCTCLTKPSAILLGLGSIFERLGKLDDRLGRPEVRLSIDGRLLVMLERLGNSDVKLLNESKLKLGASVVTSAGIMSPIKLELNQLESPANVVTCSCS